MIFIASVPCFSCQLKAALVLSRTGWTTAWKSVSSTNYLYLQWFCFCFFFLFLFWTDVYLLHLLKKVRKGPSLRMCLTFKTHVLLIRIIVAARTSVSTPAAFLPAWLVVSFLAKPAKWIQPMCFCYNDAFLLGLEELLNYILIIFVKSIIFIAAVLFFFLFFLSVSTHETLAAERPAGQVVDFSLSIIKVML